MEELKKHTALLSECIILLTKPAGMRIASKVATFKSFPLQNRTGITDPSSKKSDKDRLLVQQRSSKDRIVKNVEALEGDVKYYCPISVKLRFGL